MADTDLSDRIAHTVEELRDRAAEAVSADGHSVWRALAQLRHGIEDVAPSVVEQLDARDEAFLRHLDDLERTARRTTWPRRLVWLAAGAALGAGAAWLTDPDRGAARRADLAEQAAERARQGADELRERTRAATDRFRSQVSDLVDVDDDQAPPPQQP